MELVNIVTSSLLLVLVDVLVPEPMLMATVMFMVLVERARTRLVGRPRRSRVSLLIMMEMVGELELELVVVVEVVMEVVTERADPVMERIMTRTDTTPRQVPCIFLANSAASLS
jgi:hypothetical protein